MLSAVFVFQVWLTNHSAFCKWNHKSFALETHSPTAEAQTRAGEVLIWKEGVIAHLLVWYVPAEALAQGLKKGEQ